MACRGSQVVPRSRDQERALEGLERVIKLGFKGIVIPPNAPKDRRYSDDDFEPTWAMAEEAGLPVAFHDTLAELLVRGVCAKHPSLKFVLAEFNAGWVAHWLDKVQQGWGRGFCRKPVAHTACRRARNLEAAILRRD